jgi:hypothetical protein
MTSSVEVEVEYRTHLHRAVAVALELRDAVASTGDLAMRLYAEWYAAIRDQIEVPEDFPLDLVAVLRSAHAGSDTWEEGWIADRVSPSGRVIARRGKDVRLLERCDHVVVGRLGLLARSGDRLVVTGRRDVVDPDRGWWRTAGGSWSFARPPANLVRLYWNTSLPYLPELIRHLTALLAGTTTPWMVKCAIGMGAHGRADATLLFLTRAGAAALAEPLRTVAIAMADRARTIAPPFTFHVAPGLTAANDPGGGESFGEHRSRLIAEAVASFGPGDRQKAVESAIARLAADGVDIGRPFARIADPGLPWEP